MAYKVTKNYGKYSVIKDELIGKFYLVDVEKGETLYSSWWAKNCKFNAEMLVNGSKTVEMLNTTWNSDFGNPIELPKTLKTKQLKLQKQAAAEVANQATAAKYAIVEKDGKYLVVDTASSKAVVGTNKLPSAKGYAELLDKGELTVSDLSSFNHHMEYVDLSSAKVIESVGVSKPIGSKAPSIVEVVDKGAYSVTKMSDGTYGMFVHATGQSKLGMTSMSGASKSGNLAAKKHATEILASQGVNPGANAVDTLIDLYDGRVREMYGQAYREMAAKQAKFLERFAEADAEMVAKRDAGDITAKQLKEWRASQSAIAARNTQMVDSLAYTLSNADKKAMAMLNGYMGPAYAENMAYATYQIEKQTGISTSFTLYNQNAVDNILKNPDIQLLPEHDDAKDLAWCRKKVSSCTAQSILQGESIPHASQRLQTVVGMSANSAVRAARTALTGAQNLGTLDAAKRAQALGINLEMEWMATPDDRTRPSHRDADGQRQKVGDYFIVGIAKLEYPGDPGGGDEAWNCRCTLLPRVKGVDMSDAERWSRLPEGMTYDDWKNEHSIAQKAKVEKIQGQIDSLEAKKTTLLKTLPENKTYSGIWKDDVKLSEYPSKIESIPKKKEYYNSKIANAPAGSGGYIVKMAAQKNLDKLAEFETLGKQYADAQGLVQKQLDAIEASQKKLKERLSKIGGVNAYSDERKAAALRWSSARDADNVLRSMTEKAWKEASVAERHAIWGYTDGSGKYNRPLSGFEGGWGSYNYRGVGKVDLNYEGAKQEIRDATTFISRSTTEHDMWLRRGCGTNCMDSFFGMDFGTIGTLSNEELQQYVGHSNRIAGFVSCGTAAEGGTGFSKSVDMRIFVPKGTNATYAEPFSSYSGASYNGKTWDGVKKQMSFGHEDETIIQRGASYTCTKIEKRGYSGLYVEFEVHPEAGYDLFGQFD